MIRIVVNGQTVEAPDGASVSVNNDQVTIGGRSVPFGPERQVNIQVYGDCGDIRTTGPVAVTGNCRHISGTSGQVSVAGVTGSVTITSGSVTVAGGVGGDVNATSGNVRAGLVRGKVNTTSGNVTAPQLKDLVELTPAG